MKWLDSLATLLVAIGALNWGLVALNEDYNVVEMLGNETLIMVTYAVIGVAGLWALVVFVKGLMR